MKRQKSAEDTVRRSAEHLASKRPTMADVVDAATSSYRSTWLSAQLSFIFVCLIAMGESNCPIQVSTRMLEACRLELRTLNRDLKVVGFPLQSIQFLRQKHVTALIRLWTCSGMAREHVEWKCAALNVLLKALGKHHQVRANMCDE